MHIASRSHPARQLRIVQVVTDKLRPHPTNPRIHTPKQIGQIAACIKQVGFTNPILTDESFGIIAGHGRLAAARQLGLKTVPTIQLVGLSPAEKRAYIIADNKLGDNSRFDRKLLADEVALILDADPLFDIEFTGFAADELEILVDIGERARTREPALPPLERDRAALTRPGDLWTLGRHRLFCGNALERQSYITLLGRQRARMSFSDPPYNVPTTSITGKGRVRHDDFAMAVGEMDDAAFTAFLTTACGHLAKASADGALHYLCMDWRHQFELLTAGRGVFDRQLDLCVWAKGQPGMGAPYRQQHELIAVFKRGTRPHVNNIELGKYGRNRSNLWSYSSGPSFSAARQEELSWHATVKPLELVHDAILDASHRDDLVLDAFGGSGTTLLAAEQAGRCARLIEIDPYYCDTIIRRFEREASVKAVAHDGQTLVERERQRDVDAAREEPARG